MKVSTIAALSALAGLCPTTLAAQGRADTGSAPTLVLLITVDQMRPDYLDRWGAQLTGGLGRIRRQSVFFPLGHQEHATTETAPGHATLLSGREPTHTNIVTNGRGVPDPESPLLETSGPGASPRRFQGTTLVDWLRSRDSNTRVLSVSRKDRGAILPIGRSMAEVYWWSGGRFTTSTYYTTTLPSWVETYDERVPATLERLAGSSWTLLLPDSAYAEPDSMLFENGGDDLVFPHRLPGTAREVAKGIEKFPVMDSLTLDFAFVGAKELALGSHGQVDVLAISLSTTDAVGHAFGPDSREIHDQILRLDRWLGQFLDSLATIVPRERMITVLTADHGIGSMPEYAVMVRHEKGGRVWLGDIGRLAESRLEERYHSTFDITFDSGMLTADVTALRARGVDVDSLSAAMAAEASGRRGVARVYTPATLAAAPETDGFALRWRRTLPPGFGWLIAAVPEENYVLNGGKLGAEHGSAKESDARVPIAFVVPGISPAVVRRVVRTVDIAPTLAALLHVTPAERLDGVALPELVAFGAQHASR